MRSVFGAFFRANGAEGAGFDQPVGVDNASLRHTSLGTGIPAFSVNEVLSGNQDLIRRIKLSYGADRATFDEKVGTLIRRFAEYVHLLPATPNNYFSSPGGLLRMGLEIGFYALQATDGQIFSGHSTISSRRELEPRWRHATFIAGLCSELHRTLTHVTVTSDRSEEWPAYLIPLHSWLHRHRLARYFIRWIPDAQESRSLAVFAMPSIVPADTLQHLAEGNAVVVPHMMACISGIPLFRANNIINSLVRHAAASVIERNLQSEAQRLGHLAQGSHQSRYLVDAMRSLIASNAGWAPNTDKSRVWYAQDGLYIIWPNGAIEIAKLLESEELTGIPTTPQAILEILIAADVFLPLDEQRATWSICLPHNAGAAKGVEAAKLSSPEILFSALSAAPVPLSLVLAVPQTSTETLRPAPHAQSFGKVEPGMADHNVQASVIARTKEQGRPLDANQRIEPVLRSDIMVRDLPDTASPENAGEPFIAQLSLAAPMRLPMQLRRVLADIIETLNDADATKACSTIANGIFVPLSEIEARRVDSAQAVRALADASMLVPGPKTATYDFYGETKNGVVIHANFISGFSRHDQESDSKGGRHADSTV